MKKLEILQSVRDEKNTLLWAASNSGYIDIVKLLIESGANPESQNIYGERPITGASMGKQWDMVNYLSKELEKLYTPVPNATTTITELQSLVRFMIDRDNSKDSYLIKAAEEGNFNAAKNLVEIGVNVNYIGDEGHTPLIEAVIWNHPRIVKLLLENGANKNVLDEDDKIALDYAKSPEVIEMFDELIPVNIGEGCSGVVYRPPLKVDNFISTNRYVGKLMFKEHAEDEYENYKNINLPKSDHWIANPIFSTPSIDTVRSIQPETTGFYGSMTTQLIFEYGGMQLSEFITTKPKGEITELQIINAIEYFLTGVDKLHHFGVVHGDLTSDNVVVDGNLIFRIIDFGCSSILTDDTERYNRMHRSDIRGVGEILEEFLEYFGINNIQHPYKKLVDLIHSQTIPNTCNVDILTMGYIIDEFKKVKVALIGV